MTWEYVAISLIIFTISWTIGDKIMAWRHTGKKIIKEDGDPMNS